MKRTRQYRKGKHFIISSGDKKEVHTIKEKKGPELEFDKNYQEVYVDQFRFEQVKQGIKIYFGKKIFGTDKIKAKRTILLNKGTSRKMTGLLEDVLKKVNSDPGK